MEQFELLWNLLEKHGPSGDEGDISAFISQEAKAFCDEITTDSMGNLMARIKGTGAKVMFSAHMDSIGFVVTHIEEEGFLRVGKLGGVDPRDMLNGTVKFKNGTVGFLVKEEKNAFGKVTSNEVVIDIGAKSKEEAQKKVLLGDTAVLSIPPQKLENEEISVVAPYLDNRIACFVLLETMKQLKESPSENDLYFVFSSQEEVGVRGAKTASYTIDPDFGIAVDVTDVLDNPSSEKNGTCSLGKGTGIKIMDRSVICHHEVIATLEGLAQEKNIPHQRDILKAGGTDAGAIHMSRGGVPTGGISIPCRYIHSPAEMVNMLDVKASIDLTVAYAQNKFTKK